MNHVVYDSACTGCSACQIVCPAHCIQMREDSEGFLVPIIDVTACLNCGRCLQICPRYLTNQAKSPVRKVYACRTKDPGELQMSTSGGFFAELAKAVLLEGGIVCGACYNGLRVEHRCIYNPEDLPLLKGSKYVQSDMRTVFQPVEQATKEGKLVLISGSGCEIAAVRNYVSNPEQLITLEVVCHGVPSPGLFREYLKWLGNKKGQKITGFKFRSKHRRPSGEHSEFFYSAGRKKYVGRAYEDPYYSSFLYGRTLRDSCYQCKYKGYSRIADFTAGDFWGIEKVKNGMDAAHGLSLVLVNTQAGEKWMEKISDRMQIQKVSMEEACQMNPSILHSCKDVKLHYSLSDDGLFDHILKPPINIKNVLKNRIPYSLKNMLRKMR